MNDARSHSILKDAGLLVAVLWLWFLGTGCNTTKYLGPGRYFVKKNKIYLRHAQEIPNRAALKYELKTVLALRPNRKVLTVPRRWFYYHVQAKSDTTKLDRWILKHWAEPPAILDTTLVQRSVENLRTFMAQKAYFNAGVTYKIKRRPFRKAVVHYTVTPGPRTRVDSLELVCPDSRVNDILAPTMGRSFLRHGATLSKQNYDQEVNRIVRLLRNYGFAKFRAAHVAPLAVDTSGGITRVREEIRLFRDSFPHPLFDFGEINVFHRAQPGLQSTLLSDTLIDRIHYHPASPFDIRPGVMNNKITIRPGEQYQIDRIDETQRLLRSLDFFRIVTINQTTSERDTSKMDLNIFLTPRKKMVIGYLVDLNNSNVGSTGQNGSFLGVGGNVNFTHRNLFKGSERLQLNLDAGLDFSLVDKKKINSYLISFSGDLFFPKYIKAVPFINPGRWERVTRLRRFSEEVHKYARSQVSTGFSFVNIPNWYKYQLVNARIGIKYYSSGGGQLIVNSFGINYFNPQPGPEFIKLMEKFIYLQRSFRKQLFTGLIFRNLGLNASYSPKRGKLKYQWGGNVEVSGLEIGLANSIYNRLSGRDKIFRLGRNGHETDFSKFVKLELHGSATKEIAPNQTIGGLVRAGLAVPLFDDDEVPYVTQFYAGGPNSVRGWAIRELGPGGFKDAIASAPDYNRPYYQSGDVKLEMMSEWRFNIYWLLNGAFFLDAGNVWTLHPDPERPGSAFTSDFYRQIAVGTGFGLRLDVKYTIIRFDMGLKLRNPYPNDEGYYWINYGGGFRNVRFKDFNYNIQIGLPF